MKPLTPRQAEVLELIKANMSETGMPPTRAEIAQKLGVSVPRVRQYLAQGIRQCYIALYGEPT